jgi:hypothetical protein
MTLPILQTARLRLIAASAELMEQELAGNVALAAALNVGVAASWPPDTLTDALPWFAERLQTAPELMG